MYSLFVTAFVTQCRQSQFPRVGSDENIGFTLLAGLLVLERGAVLVQRLLQGSSPTLFTLEETWVRNWIRIEGAW